jgi:hypothetical protein
MASNQQNAAPRLVLLAGTLGVTGIMQTVLGLLSGSLGSMLLGGIVGGPGLFLASYYRREYEVRPSEVAIAIGQVVDDFDLALNGVDNWGDLAPAIARRLRPMTTLVLEDDSPSQWVTGDFWSWHTAYIGNSGSHKSVNFKHHADMVAQQFGIDAIWGICDSHFDPTEASAIDTWFKGVPRDQLPFYKEPEKQFAALKKFYGEFKRRKENNLKAEPMAALFVDEFERAFPEGQLDQAIKMLADIVDEGRKYQMRLFISNQSPKKERSGLDSGILSTMTMVLMGETVGDSTVRWPQDIGSKAKALIADVQAAMSSRPGAEYVTAVIRPGSYCKLSFRGPHVRHLPDRSRDQIHWQYEPLDLEGELRAAAADAIAAGGVNSFTGLCRALGLHGAMGLANAPGRKYRDDRVQLLFEMYGEQF